MLKYQKRIRGISMTLKEEYISFLGPGHLVYLTGFFLAFYFLMKKRKAVRAHADRADKILATIIIVQQILLYGTYIFHYDFVLSESLPFHICRMASLVILAYLFTKKRTLYIIGTAFGFFALLSFAYPLKVVPMNHPIGLSFFVSHTVNLLFGLYGRITRGYRISNRDLPTALRAFFIYFIFAYLLNPLVDGNYFYFKEKPLVGDMPDLMYVPLCLAVSSLLITLGIKLYSSMDRHGVKESEKPRLS